MRKMLLCVCAAAAVWSCGARDVPPGPTAPLSLEKSIPLPGVHGRIDHLALDPEHERLFVAEIANGTVDAIDLRTGARSTIAGFNEPQGVAWLGRTDEVAVASGDGTVKFFAGDDLKQTAMLRLGDDADDVRVDAATGELVVGYGSGGLAAIDPQTHRVVSRLALPAHPEGFSISGVSGFINLPDAGSIVSARLDQGRIVARWGTGLRRLNFPIALDEQATLLAVGFRLPSTMQLLDPRSGQVRQSLGTCGDADDLYFDARLKQIYVICGSGEVDVFRNESGEYGRIASVTTRRGARTGLFDPVSNLLFVAAPANGDRPAAILVLSPTGAARTPS